MAFTFKGGIHPYQRKNTKKCGVTPITPPLSVCIPMLQHIGSPCVPCVKKGDRVNKGQVIGQPEQGLGAPIHASISGTVSAITETLSATGSTIPAVVIENDFENRIHPDIHPFEGDIKTVTAEEIVEVVKNAGIVGLGGATFPTHAKLSSAIGKATRLIINCAECEPHITANHRLLLEQPQRVIGGIKILLKALSLRSAVIAIEKNKMDAVKALAGQDFPREMIRICVMKTKYPQGDERQLIYALSGKELPAGKLPADLGYVVFNAETCAAIYSAFESGMPLVERIVTVDGDCVSAPGNLLVPIGTPVSELLAYCETKNERIKTLISGGPMMGRALWDIETPVTKGVCAVLAYSEKTEKHRPRQTACIRCGKCITACPMHLMPREIYKAKNKADLALCEQYFALNCVECGSCSYTCPAGIELTQTIKSAKLAIRNKKAAEKASATVGQSTKEERK